MRSRGERRLTGQAAGPGVLLVTAEPLSARMAGPAIRMLELGRALAADGRSGPVTVASLAAAELPDPPVATVAVADGAELAALARGVGSVIVQGDVLGLHPQLAASDVPVVVDAYDPFHLEQLERTRGLPPRTRRAVVRDAVTSLNLQLSRADFLLCASPRQRALWLGHLAALGRLNPLTYDLAADLSGLVAVVPFGTPTRPPAERVRGVWSALIPEISPDDVVLVWGGGIYPWLDPVTLVRAVAATEESLPRLRLVFLGTRHPVPGVDATASTARDVARVEGVLGRRVFFHEGWVPYEERDRWLRAADLAVSTHLDHLETEFSFRTRVLDYLWCGLPVVCTAGDELADLLQRSGAGTAVPAGDVAALAAALVELASSETIRRERAAAAERLGREMSWARVSRPLADFCADPRRAPDLALDPVDRLQLGLGRVGPARGSVVQRVRAALGEGGAALLLRRLRARAVPGARRP